MEDNHKWTSANGWSDALLSSYNYIGTAPYVAAIHGKEEVVKLAKSFCKRRVSRNNIVDDPRRVLPQSELRQYLCRV